MAHAQKPDFVFRRNGRVHLNRQGASVQSTTGSQGVCISGNNAGYTMFWGSVTGTGYPLHSPVSPSIPFPCITVCHHVSTGLYFISLNNYTIFFVFNLNHINNSRNAVLLNSVKPGYKLGGIKFTNHDDDKGRVGGPTENGMSSYNDTDNTKTNK
jgi:hypothetical protein